jgi:hypothetical protein
MERYERETNLSIYWFNRANDLRGAAGAVWFAIENSTDQIRDFLGMDSGYSFSIACPSVYLMLCGLSLELLYKALIVELGKKPPETHNLRQLSSLANVTLSTEDLELIDILTDHIQWAGKYPVPKGDRTKWNQHVERMSSALTTRIPGSSINIRRTNHRLNWNDFARIWNIGDSLYRRLYLYR